MRSKEQERSDFALQQLQPMIAGNHGGVDKDLCNIHSWNAYNDFAKWIGSDYGVSSFKM